ncbi:ADP-heptose:LPS heptosyltransferase [Granulicella arctica]|uniref:ADP-heptose:LPS heptosyltransferase n=2 Tax=Granulicella arctica TaxID=940613 RepID=A0A7Y9PIX5_9BACT|nr:ADP-heptose:LPS heptosyltransferase [Granulicella arctica]
MLSPVLLALERIVRKKQVAPAQVRQLLILEYRLPLGCCVHLTPLFEALKRCRPELCIAVATRGLGSQVLRHSPFIDHLIETPDPLIDLCSTVKHLRHALRTLNFTPDCVLTGASDQRTRISLLGLFASSGWRGGYTQKPALYQRPLVYDRTLSLINNNLRLAKLLDCTPQIKEPHVSFSQSDAEAAASLLRQANPQGNPIVIMVTANSGGQSTGWHSDRFVQVIKAAHTRGCTVVYVGTAADVNPIEALSQAANGIGTSIAGKTTVTQLAAVLAMSDVMVTLDTGTMHVGRATGVPMVVLGPSWQKPLEWLPLGIENVRILRGEDRDTVPSNYHLDEISADSVIAALNELLLKYPASLKARESRIQRSLANVDHLPR